MLERMASTTIGSVRQRRDMLAFGARGQPVPDCRQAKTAAARASAGNVELAAADKAMADSYTRLAREIAPNSRRRCSPISGAGSLRGPRVR